MEIVHKYIKNIEAKEKNYTFGAVKRISTQR